MYTTWWLNEYLFVLVTVLARGPCRTTDRAHPPQAVSAAWILSAPPVPLSVGGATGAKHAVTVEAGEAGVELAVPAAVVAIGDSGFPWQPLQET